MQLTRGRRAIALLLAGCVLLSGLVVLRHETTVAHVRGASGEVEHAHALAEAHELDTTPHLHGRDADAHAEVGVCALLAALDHATICPDGPTATAIAQPHVLRALAPVPFDVSARALYRLAPKTSPPSHG